MKVKRTGAWTANKAAMARRGQVSDPALLVAFGGTVKALGDGKFSAPLVTFSTSAAPDLVGDFFTKSTKFWKDFPGAIPLLYAHAQDPVLKSTTLGASGSATVTQDDAGVWMEGQLNLANAYEAAIYKMIEAGKMGTSSGSAPHLVERKQIGDAWEITSWPLVEASLTPTPAEPRNKVVPIKSLKASILGALSAPSWWEEEYDGEWDFDPAEEMTCAAAEAIHYRFRCAVERVIRMDGVSAADRVEILRRLVEEYTDLLITSADALLSAITDPDEPDGDETEQVADAAEILKSLIGGGARHKPASLKDFERFLREAGSFSRKEATAIASTGFRPLLRDAASDDTSPSIDAMKQALLNDALRIDSRTLGIKSARLAGVNG